MESAYTANTHDSGGNKHAPKRTASERSPAGIQVARGSQICALFCTVEPDKG